MSELNNLITEIKAYFVGEGERKRFIDKTLLALPDNPSNQGISPRQIKLYGSQSQIQLYDWLNKYNITLSELLQLIDEQINNILKYMFYYIKSYIFLGFIGGLGLFGTPGNGGRGISGLCGGLLIPNNWFNIRIFIKSLKVLFLLLYLFFDTSTLFSVCLTWFCDAIDWFILLWILEWLELLFMLVVLVSFGLSITLFSKTVLLLGLGTVTLTLIVSSPELSHSIFKYISSVICSINSLVIALEFASHILHIMGFNILYISGYNSKISLLYLGMLLCIYS